MKRLMIMALIATTVGFVGCEVEQTEKGALPDVDVDAKAGQLPKYEVTKTQEGKLPDVDVDVDGGKLPEFEVRGPDVTIGTEEKTITVPTIDIDMPDDDDESIDKD